MGKIFKNYIYNSVYQIVAIIIPLITTPYLTRVLGAANLGSQAYVLSVAQIFNTVGMIGLNFYSSREIAYVRDDRKETSKVFFELVLARVLLLVATTVVYIPVVLQSEYKILFLIQTIWLVAMFMDLSWFFNGLEIFGITALRNVIVKVITIICIFAFVKTADDLALYTFIYAVSQLVGTLSLVPQLRRHLMKVPAKALCIKRHFLPSIKVLLPQLAGVLYLQVDKVMIEMLSSVEELGFYEGAERLVKAPMAVITAISTTLMPRVANEFKNRNSSKVKEYLGGSLEFSMLLAWPLMFGLIGIASGLIPWFLGEEFAPSVTALILLSITIVPIATTSVTANQFYIATNRTKPLTVSYIFSAVFNLAINALLIPRMGFAGAAIGSIVAEVTALLLQCYIMNRSVKVIKPFLFSCLKYGGYGAVMCGVILLLGTVLPVSIVSTAIQILTGFAVYCILLLVTKDKFVRKGLQKVFHKKSV